MQLLASWRDSLKMFYPLNNLKLFVFATIRAVQMAAPSVGVLLLGFLTMVLCADYIFEVGGEGDFLTTFVSMWFLLYIQMFIYLMVRPSVGIKDVTYWYGHRKHLAVAAFLSVVLVTFSWVIPLGFHYVRTAPVGLVVKFLVLVVWMPWSFINILFFMVMPFSLFFFFDSRGSFVDLRHSFLRAVRMITYNMPLWFVLYILFSLFELLPNSLPEEGRMWVYGTIALTFITQFIMSCTWSVFYTKRLHEQFELYFPVKK